MCASLWLCYISDIVVYVRVPRVSRRNDSTITKKNMQSESDREVPQYRIRRKIYHLLPYLDDLPTNTSPDLSFYVPTWDHDTFRFEAGMVSKFNSPEQNVISLFNRLQAFQSVLRDRYDTVSGVYIGKTKTNSMCRRLEAHLKRLNGNEMLVMQALATFTESDIPEVLREYDYTPNEMAYFYERRLTEHVRRHYRAGGAMRLIDGNAAATAGIGGCSPDITATAVVYAFFVCCNVEGNGTHKGTIKRARHE